MESEPRQILLNERKNKFSTNEDNFVGVELFSYEKPIPHTEETYHIDAYQQYFKEKDESEKHRFAFTITPFCTNVLFNVVTEPVYKEGSNECFAVLDTTASRNPFTNYNSRPLNRQNAIRDTGYSHPKAGDSPLVYHCGIDIFNNHFLRKREFNVVNKSVKTNQKFNTIEDNLRTRSGENIREAILQINNGTTRLNTTETDIHLYQYDTIDTFADSAYDNIVESNGWFGFLNPTTIPIKNFGDFSINKCMNNNKAWEQIDMYPDRSLFSFVPKINKYRGRTERNWDYMITYPYAMDDEHPIVRYKYGSLEVNGLRCKFDTEITQSLRYEEGTLITFKSFARHNLHPGEYVSMSFIDNPDNERKTPVPVVVVNTGKDGYDSEHYFSVRLSDIFNEICDSQGSTNNPGLLMGIQFTDIRFRKNEDGSDCVYYLRKFKKIDGDPTSSLNKLAFSQNIYSDQVAQIVFTEDILSTQTDHLGRKLSEVFLTIVKTNKGHGKWYDENKFSDEDIEFSHCFGEITSGFDFPTDEECEDYNVHRIHSVDGNVSNITESPKKLETGITLDSDDFYGDLVEFSLSRLEETVIEDVYHRFNTAQRETTSENYSSFMYDEIEHDDYDIGESGLTVTEKPFLGGNSHVNVVPEGYYYKPHYSVKIREFEQEVQQGSHIKIAYKSATKNGNDKNWTIQTSKNYYFVGQQEYEAEGVTRYTTGETVYVYVFDNDGKVSGEAVRGRCSSVTGEDFCTVTFELEKDVDIVHENVAIFKHNPAMPEYAYTIQDGTGRYIWREPLSYADMVPDNELYEDMFANGAHYHHKNIMFYLKRQDPYGYYGIGNEPSEIALFLLMKGEEKDVSKAEFLIEGSETVC